MTVWIFRRSFGRCRSGRCTGGRLRLVGRIFATVLSLVVLLFFWLLAAGLPGNLAHLLGYLLYPLHHCLRQLPSHAHHLLRQLGGLARHLHGHLHHLPELAGALRRGTSRTGRTGP